MKIHTMSGEVVDVHMLAVIRRMKNVLLLICMLLSLESKGQNQTSEESLNERLDIKPLAQSPAKAEFRLYNQGASAYGGSVLMLRKKRKKWQGWFYVYNFGPGLKPQQQVKRFSVQPAHGWDNLWQGLLALGADRLPDMWQVLERDKVVEIDSIFGKRREYKTIITDGVGHSVACKAQGKVVTYRYSNMKNYQNAYPETTEIKDFIQIMVLLKREFNLELY
jgi:hypothetical protein